ncbi:unnamed protein product [Arctia plantaginis]|uniref:Uncharacterized protein n=1 Tax=Arctia plantaginis TaxID=874455 RepID=A0A8S1BQW5_ARCPL|nr:unnamed protein product [Arctia plantaginis]
MIVSSLSSSTQLQFYIREPSKADIHHIHHDVSSNFYGDDPKPPDRHYPVKHAGLPRGLAVYPLPLKNSDHELNFNVSWIPPFGPPARDYSLEVRSVTDTVDCRTPMCYEYNIPGESTWWLIPAFSNPIVETCAVRPGCAYMVRLIAHPWDGQTSANLLVELDECVENVCSCAHSPRLPAPLVSTKTVVIHDEMFANITWSLQPPQYLQRLPSGLRKKSYIVSLGKQMVSDAHPAPWFANIITRNVDADGLISVGDSPHFILLPVIGQKGERKDKRLKSDKPEVKLLARVTLIDDRGCLGPAGNATAFNPSAEPSKFSFGVYAVILAIAGAWVLGVVFVLSARFVKHVLKSLRSTPVSAPLETISRRPAWFPLQLRT